MLHLQYITIVSYSSEDVTSSAVTLSSATISWRIPYFLFQEQYYVEYGTDPYNLNETTAPIQSPSDTTATDNDYSTPLQELEPSTVYFFRVVAVYDEIYRRYSDVGALRTKEPGTSVIDSFLLILNHNCAFC